MTTPSQAPPLPPSSTLSTSVPSPSPTPYQPTKAQHLHYLHQTITLAKLSPPKPSNFRVGCVIVSYPEISSSSSTTINTTGQERQEEGEIISTGYTLELEGNTHAEQNALTKLFSQSQSQPSSSSSETNTNTNTNLQTNHKNVYLYTSLEPCSLRLSGNKSCVNRIIDLKKNNNLNINLNITKIVFGAKEPSTFVKESKSCLLLDEANIKWEYISDLEHEILSVAMEGHNNNNNNNNNNTTNTDMKETGEEGMKTGVGVEGMSTLHARVDAMAANGGMTKKTDVSHEVEEERRRQQQEEEEKQPRNPKKRMMEVS